MVAGFMVDYLTKAKQTHSVDKYQAGTTTKCGYYALAYIADTAVTKRHAILRQFYILMHDALVIIPFNPFDAAAISDRGEHIWN